MENKKICFSAIALASLFAFAGCSTKPFEVQLGYTDGTIVAKDEDGEEILKGLEYNESLFYRNDLTLAHVADPSVIYVEDENKLYLYGTSDTLDTRGVGVWVSDDGGIHWDSYGVAFEPEYDSWSYTSLWAPEVIYDSATELYYMTYTADNSNAEYYNDKYIGMAYAENPAGPFVQWTGTNQNGVEIGLKNPIFDPALIEKFNGEIVADGAFENYRFIDSSYFIDDDGAIYMYLVRAFGEMYTDKTLQETSDIWGMKMKDFATPDYTTVTQLTKVGYNTAKGVAGDENDVDQDRTMGENTNINEAPFMYKKEGTYYLTYSVGNATSILYSVAQATCDSPLGEFRKLSKAEGGLILGADGDWDQNAGTAHACLTEIGDELFIFHHEGRDRNSASDLTNRAIAYNRLGFMKNANDKEVLVANGPTSFSLQALPTEFSGYENIAKDATITANGLVSGSDVKYLNDGFFASHSYGLVKETEFSAKETITVKMSWSDYRKMSAIMLYNSIDYQKIFYQIARITLEIRTPSGLEGKAIVNNATFPLNDTTCYGFDERMYAGSNLVLNFNELEAKSIEITFRAPRTEGSVAISDIWVLGK